MRYNNTEYEVVTLEQIAETKLEFSEEGEPQYKEYVAIPRSCLKKQELELCKVDKIHPSQLNISDLEHLLGDIAPYDHWLKLSYQTEHYRAEVELVTTLVHSFDDNFIYIGPIVDTELVNTSNVPEHLQ